MAQQDLVEKWEPVLEAKCTPTITDSYKKKVIAQLCENTIVESRNNQ